MTTTAGRPDTELCAYCNTPLTEDDKFCGGCGQRVPSRSEVPLTAFIADEPDPYATVASAVPDPLAGVPGPFSGPADPAGSYPEPTGRAWPGTAESSPAAVWPGSGERVEANEASVGQATPNSTYIGMRLQYDKVPEPPFDPIDNVRFIAQLAKRLVVYLLVYALGAAGGALFWLVASAVVGVAHALDGYVICDFLVGLTLFCLYVLLPLPVLLSEWKFSVDGKGAAGAAAFEHIAWTLRQRETPLDSVQVRRLRLAGTGTRDYLELRHGLFIGFIACFPYGKDLYVGWTFYFRLSPLRYTFMALARIWQTLFNRHTDMYVTLRYDSARAMREAMHSAAREGLDVAIGELVPQGHGISGGQLHVTDIAE
jgi:hypothetical protein